LIFKRAQSAGVMNFGIRYVEVSKSSRHFLVQNRQKASEVCSYDFHFLTILSSKIFSPVLNFRWEMVLLIVNSYAIDLLNIKIQEFY
jgi:hypothetical protein